MTKQDIEQTIANVEQQLASLKAELLKQAEPEPTKKWARKGSWVLMGGGNVFGNNLFSPYTVHAYASQGRTYQTIEAAESVKPYDAFYGLLCGLACELNPSGKVKTGHCVYYSQGKWCTYLCNSWEVASLFETADAAEQAAAILNRDGIKPLQAGGAK